MNNLKYKIFFSVIIFCGFFGLAEKSQADTHTVTACNDTNVQSAINLAADGDTVYMDCATGTWSSEVQITNKSLTLQGRTADYKNGSTATTITSSDKIAVNLNSSSYIVTLKDFKYSGVGGVGNEIFGSMLAGGNLENFRMTNVWVSWTENYGFSIFGTNGVNNGLIDNCRFEPINYNVGSAIYVDGVGTSAAFAGDSTLGTANNVFVEDCVFTRSQYMGASHGIWSQNGGSYVLRHNTLTNWDIDVHGHCSGGGSRNFEIYNNTMAFDSSANQNTMINIRGGTGVVYNNDATDPGTYSLFHLWEQQIEDGYNMCGCPCTSYPCLHQLGRGKNDILEPTYFWNNRIRPNLGSSWTYVSGSGTGTGHDPLCLNAPNEETVIMASRDFYESQNTAKPGYTAYTYPHPLRNEGTPDTTPPAAPSGLAVN
jgi:hypothetical protein